MRRLYARQRTPWGFTYGVSATNGEDVGGIFKSTNGGGTWKKLAGGLPGQTGRIGLAISASNPKIVMATVQSDEGGASDIRDIHSRAGGVFRSEDGGEKWTRMSDINPRPFYFSEIKIDPANDQRVYVLGFAILMSDDAGRTFREDHSEKVHPDCHTLAIQPGTRPAAEAAETGGQKQTAEAAGLSARLVRHGWRRLPKLLRRQRLGSSGDASRRDSSTGSRVDDTQPFYRIAGGLQDNTNWVGPSGVNSKDGIMQRRLDESRRRRRILCRLRSQRSRHVLRRESARLHSPDQHSHRRDARAPPRAGGRPAGVTASIGTRRSFPASTSRARSISAGNRVFRLTDRAEKFTPHQSRSDA